MTTPDIDWTDNPDAASRTAAYQLHRCPAQGSYQGLILSIKHIGVKVHFWRGRTRPHVTGHCPACADKSPWRWRGYLAIAHPVNLGRSALEITAPCAGPIDDYLKTWGTLRGGLIKLWRPSGKANGKLACTIERSNHPPDNLPQPIDLEGLLLKLWELHQPHADPQFNTLGNRFHQNGETTEHSNGSLSE